MRPIGEASVRFDRQNTAFKSLRTNFRDLRDVIVVPGVGAPAEGRPQEINAIILKFLRDINFQYQAERTMDDQDKCRLAAPGYPPLVARTHDAQPSPRPVSGVRE